MAVKKATATAATKQAKPPVDAAGRRVKKAGEAPLARFVDSPVTALQESFVEWIEANTGYKADPKSVQLGAVLRSEFQKSESNQARIAARKAELEQEAIDRAARAAERAEKRAAKEAAKAEAAANPKPKAEPKAKAAPAAKATKAPAKAKAAPATKPAAKPAAKKPAPATTRRRAARSTAVEVDEDF